MDDFNKDLHTPLVARDSISKDLFDSRVTPMIEDAKEKERLVAALADVVEKDDRESLEGCSLEQLRNLRLALSLISFSASNLASLGPSETSSKSYYLMGYAAYKGTNWNKNVTLLLDNGLGERVPDLCIILQWAAEGLDIFTERAIVITASLDIDMKVAVMKTLSPCFVELENADYVEKLKKGFRQNPSASQIARYVKKLQKSRSKKAFYNIKNGSNIINDARQEYISGIINPARKTYILRQSGRCSIM